MLAAVVPVFFKQEL